MTVPRVVLLLLACIVFADYRFGNGRLIESVSAQTTQLGYKLSDELSKLERLIMPNR